MNGPYPTDLKLPGRRPSPDLLSFTEVLNVAGAGRSVYLSSFYHAVGREDEKKDEETNSDNQNG